MKSTELRIGNFYIDEDGNESKVDLDTFRRLCECIIEDDDLWGIPLNKGWLLKFGFEYKGIVGKSRFLTKYTKCGKALVYKEGYILFVGVTIEHPIQFVHQLQNLFFALTNEELIYTL